MEETVVQKACKEPLVNQSQNYSESPQIAEYDAQVARFFVFGYSNNLDILKDWVWFTVGFLARVVSLFCLFHVVCQVPERQI